MKILLIVIMLGLTSHFDLAHPGRTDANGGHYNRKTGEYHYHSGPKKNASEKHAEVRKSKTSSKSHFQDQ